MYAQFVEYLFQIHKVQQTTLNEFGTNSIQNGVCRLRQ